MRTSLYNAFPTQINVNVEEVLSSLLLKPLRKFKNVGRGLWLEHINFYEYTIDDLK